MIAIAIEYDFLAKKYAWKLCHETFLIWMSVSLCVCVRVFALKRTVCCVAKTLSMTQKQNMSVVLRVEHEKFGNKKQLCVLQVSKF